MDFHHSTEITVELDVDDICDLPPRKVTVKFDPSRVDYDQLTTDIVTQVQNYYSNYLEDMDLATQLTCKLHFHRMATGIVQKLKVETYRAIY